MREVLGWINDPKTVQARMSTEQWDAFCHSCKDKFKFQPAKDGPLRAAELMGGRQDNWQQVWNRFREGKAATVRPKREYHTVSGPKMLCSALSIPRALVISMLT